MTPRILFRLSATLALGVMASHAPVALAQDAARSTAQGTPSLDRLIAFDNPADPTLTEQSGALFGGIWTQASAPANLSLPGIGLVQVSTAAAPRSGWVSNTLALEGDWHGLSLTRFALNGLPDSGVGSYELFFRDSPAQVLATVQALGFPVAATGIEARTGDEGCGSRLVVESAAAGSVFRISFTC